MGIPCHANEHPIQVVSSEAAWASIGFSSDGMMIGSDAVVGLPDDASVQEYEMTGQVRSPVLPSVRCGAFLSLPLCSGVKRAKCCDYYVYLEFSGAAFHSNVVVGTVPLCSTDRCVS